MIGDVDDLGAATKPSMMFLPATFEERGTYAPFTTPVMLASRIRPDERHRIVVLMPSFSGSQGSLVVPWKALPDVITMTVHDRALYDEISEVKALTPDAMRGAGLRVALTGLAGPRAKDAAEAALKADENQRLETQLFVMLRLLHMLDIDDSALLSVDVTGSDWEAAAKTMLVDAAGRLKLDVDTVYENLDEISRLLAPIGLAALDQAGRLRRMLTAIDRLRDSNDTATIDALPEVADLHQFAVVVAQHTMEVGERLLARADSMVRNLPRIIGEWESERDSIAQAIGRVAWLLDGWDQALGAWSQIIELPGLERNAQLPYFIRLLPMVPRQETGKYEAATRMRLDKIYQTNRVKNLEDWRSGETDVELVRRIEQARTKAVRIGAPAIL
jgi:hypothetical protein